MAKCPYRGAAEQHPYERQPEGGAFCRSPIAARPYETGACFVRQNTARDEGESGERPELHTSQVCDPPHTWTNRTIARRGGLV